jgi:hypothetical protein
MLPSAGTYTGLGHELDHAILCENGREEEVGRGHACPDSSTWKNEGAENKCK